MGAEKNGTADPALLGVLDLLAAKGAEREPEPKLPAQLVLAGAGLDDQLIATVLGKRSDAGRMKINRAGGSAKGMAKG